MREKIAERLLSVKSLVTLLLSAVFAYLAVRGSIEGKDFMTVFLMIISFYFGTQAMKKEEKAEEPDAPPSAAAIGFERDKENGNDKGN